MDRDELQDRIRARRAGGDPYRRGGAAGEGAYERFQPEPGDEVARRGAANAPRRDLLDEPPPPPPAAVRGASRTGAGDITRDHDDWASPRRAEPDREAAPVAAATTYDDADPDARGRGDEYPLYEEYPYADVSAYEDWEEDQRDRRTAGAGALAILGFLALGVVALLGGAALAGIFGGDDGAQAVASPSPSASAVVRPSTEPAPSEQDEPSEAPATPEPAASGDPVVFPDGFTAEVQPCIPGSSGPDGCNQSGSVNAGQVEIWVGFENGTENDVIGVELLGPDGSTITTGSIPLADIGCQPTCPRGWAYVSFSQLPTGTYEVVVTRNGDRAGDTSFTVS